MPNSITIKQGDTLSTLAAANKTDVETLAKLNKIADPDKIQAGATLALPDAPVVESSIADAFSGTPSVATSDAIRAGQAKETADIATQDQKDEQELARLARQKQIADLRSNLGLDAPTPEKPDLVGTFNRLRDEQGITTLEGQLSDVKARELKLQDEFRQFEESQQGLGREQGFVEGTVAEKGKEIQKQLDAIARQKAVLVDELVTKNRTVETIMNLTAKQYDDARADYEATYKRALDTYNLLADQRDEERTEERDRVNSAKATLSVYRDAFEQGTVSYENLSPEQQAEIDRLDLVAYGVSGVTKLLGPKEQELDTFTDENGNRVSVFYNPGTKSTRQIVLGKTSGQSTPATIAERQAASLSEYANVFVPGATYEGMPVIGEDGLIDPRVWKDAIADAINRGLTRKSFIEQFGYLVNLSTKKSKGETKPVDEYGLTATELKLITGEL